MRFLERKNQLILENSFFFQATPQISYYFWKFWLNSKECLVFIQLLYHTTLKIVILIFNHYFSSVEEPILNHLLHYSPRWLVVFITAYYISGHSKIGANERREMMSHITFHVTKSSLQCTWQSCFTANAVGENMWLNLGWEGRGKDNERVIVLC